MSGKGKMNKPPLGVKPSFVAGEERIASLCDAIERNLEYGAYSQIKKWAKEIYLQSDLLLQMESEDDS